MGGGAFLPMRRSRVAAGTSGQGGALNIRLSLQLLLGEGGGSTVRQSTNTSRLLTRRMWTTRRPLKRLPSAAASPIEWGGRGAGGGGVSGRLRWLRGSCYVWHAWVVKGWVRRCSDNSQVPVEVLQSAMYVQLLLNAQVGGVGGAGERRGGGWGGEAGARRKS